MKTDSAIMLTTFFLMIGMILVCLVISYQHTHRMADMCETAMLESDPIIVQGEWSVWSIDIDEEPYFVVRSMHGVVLFEHITQPIRPDVSPAKRRHP